MSTHGGASAMAIVEPRMPMGMHPAAQAITAKDVNRHASIFIEHSATPGEIPSARRHFALKNAGLLEYRTALEAS